MKPVLLALIFTPLLSAQCVMCNRTAAAQNLARASVLNNGIVVLIIPPLLILAALVWYALSLLKKTVPPVSHSRPQGSGVPE
jgi:hypothetical protein